MANTNKGYIRPMFPHVVDSSMLAAFRSCPQKFFRTYMEHWKPKDESVHLVAGKAFASGIEAARRAFYEQGKGMADAQSIGLYELIRAYGDFIPPDSSAKTLDRMCGALEFYFANYELGNDGMVPYEQGGKLGIEFSFANPLPVNHPVTGDPIIFSGRADLLAKFAGGVYLVDEKTTTSLGPSWARQWEMRSQFTGYSWACREYGVPVDGTIIRGVSILKTKYDTQQAITYRAAWEVERWLEQTTRDLQRMITMWDNGWFDYALDGACTEYGGCSMVTICKSNDPETWLPMYFTKRVWDPLTREEVSVEQYELSWGHSPEIMGA